MKKFALSAFLLALALMIVTPNLYLPSAKGSGTLPWSFRDDFNYTSIGQLQAGGWSINPNVNVPPSYYGFRNSTITLYANGPDNTAFVSRNDFPANVSNWSVSVRGKGGFQDLVPTAGHLYSWTANDGTNTLTLSMDYKAVASFSGYTVQSTAWHILQLDMISGTLYMYFEGSFVGNYTEPDKTLGNTNLKALEISGPFGFGTSYFDWVQATNSPLLQTPFFRMKANPPSLSLPLGASGNTTLQVASFAGFSGYVSLTVITPSPGPRVQISPTILTVAKGGSANSTFNVTSQNTTISTNYPVNVTATSGGLSVSMIVNVYVNPNHAPIIIVGNSGFTTANGVSSGTGTASDPYIISGWFIRGWSYPSSWNAPNATIAITNTTAYFVIKNVNADGVGNGIRLYNVANGVIEDSSASSYYTSPVWIVSSRNILFSSGLVGGGGNCTSPSSCSPADGFYASGDSALTVYNNTIGGELGNGVAIHGSSNVFVERNTFDSNVDWNFAANGLLLDSSMNVTVSGNSFDQNGIIVSGNRQQLTSYTITMDNLANGLPIYYYVGCSGQRIYGVSAGQVIIAYCTNVTVSNLRLSKDFVPLQLISVNSALVTHNVIDGTFFVEGVVVSASSQITISFNNFSSTNNQYYYSEGLVLSHVTNSTVSGNNFLGNHIGLDISWSGVHVFHNNFVLNVNCCTSAGDSGTANTWDNGFPSGGNYWSNYSGSDPDNDGIGDTAYSVCCVGTVDRYPLMKSFPANNTPTVTINSSMSFFGVTVTTSGSLSFLSGTFSGSIQVVATNSSSGAILFSKTFTITNLSNNKNQAIFVLNIPISPYPLSSDITLHMNGASWASMVTITRQLDIAGSGTVDIIDLATMATHFDSSVGTANYSPTADVLGRGSIDIIDIATAAMYFGSPVYY